MTYRWQRLSTLFVALVALLSLAPVLVPPAEGQQYQRFFVAAVGDNNEVITSGSCRVLTAGTFNTTATVYTAGDLASSATNPIALDSTLGTCSWYAPTATTSFDVVVYVTSGNYKGLVARVDGITRSSMKRIIFVRSQAVRSLIIPYATNAVTQTSAVTLPAGAIVKDAQIEATASAVGATVTFGWNGSATGLCNATAAASVGFFNCAPSAAQIGTSALALTYSTTAHTQAGFLRVWYLLAGGN